MSFDPSRFFIGVIDFFSVLMPGALLAFVLRDPAEAWLLPAGEAWPEGGSGWAAFAFAAYLLGHVVFLLGSVLLDPWLYDPLRQGTVAAHTRRLARGEGALPGPVRALARRIFSPFADRAQLGAAAVRDHYLGRMGATGSVNAYQWAKARLAVDHPQGLAAVHRFEADSKFFRSLAVVMPFLVVWAWGRPLAVAAGLVLFVLALWRYVDQRVKQTSQAYWNVLALEGLREDGYRGRGPVDAWPTHAGAVVVQDRGGTPHYLLVEASDGGSWVLPKGHVERGEGSAEAAVREVREEAGVWGQVVGWLDDVALDVDGEAVRSRFFLAEAVAKAAGDERGGERRRAVWLPFGAALERASHLESRELLRAADTRWQALEGCDGGKASWRPFRH